MTKLDTLIKARKLLSDPRRWTRGNFTREVDGVQCFCALGAIAAATSNGRTAYPNELIGVGESQLYEDAATAVARAINGPWADSSYVWRYNDEHGRKYEDVMAKFSDAIQAEVANS